MIADRQIECFRALCSARLCSALLGMQYDAYARASVSVCSRLDAATLGRTCRRPGPLGVKFRGEAYTAPYSRAELCSAGLGGAGRGGRRAAARCDDRGREVAAFGVASAPVEVLQLPLTRLGGNKCPVSKRRPARRRTVLSHAFL